MPKEILQIIIIIIIILIKSVDMHKAVPTTGYKGSKTILE